MTDRSYTPEEKRQRARLIARGVIKAARGKSVHGIDRQFDRIEARAELRAMDESEARYRAQRDLDKAEADAKAVNIRIKAAGVRADTADRIKKGRA